MAINIQDHKVKAVFDDAHRNSRPVFMIVIATKPCYVKLASLVRACEEQNISTLIIESGQHYDAVLTEAGTLFDITDKIAINLNVTGNMLKKAASMALAVEQLTHYFAELAPNTCVVPVVSGDTLTSNLLPQYWYLATGVRAVHVEAGLRSMGPASWQSLRGENLLLQRQSDWVRYRDMPFPEGIDTVLTSCVSDLLLAPIERNQRILLKEGYSPENIDIVGSLSADAVVLQSKQQPQKTIYQCFPELAHGTWIRVDIHRRENLTKPILTALLKALIKLVSEHIQIVFVKYNAFTRAIDKYQLDALLEKASEAGVVFQPLWPSYQHVLEFVTGKHCRFVYSDSGGLQEELHTLNVPMLTCRANTDRPETVLDSQSNLLLPPLDDAFIYAGLRLAIDEPQKVWPTSAAQKLYGDDVGQTIAASLARYQNKVKRHIDTLEGY
ncbi:UDP-N-acetylglucosamine 2-epimerase [Pseudoalteromonas sp. SMS1]|uniref:UDP-N-acetylglucosamine 2-epimerase n=1 Tax=Pseudoalteromonas sp. SMS1 TaxID=2908894 RepID=UPI001F3830A3|nr:UDP-N-acetylglucosamine 2-epimerase [Pseudoalteromonas sp. SMS1]MCF2856405.1 UDP-N-acetylglucosamine 2-epimerase [Pseudoalteromonas sp. SMS1]